MKLQLLESGTALAVCLAIALAGVVTGAGAQEVTLALETFDKLYTSAHPTPPEEPAPPLPYAVDEASLQIHAGSDSARIVQELSLRLLAEGWQTIPLATTGTFLSAELGSLEGRVTGKQHRALSVRGSGRYTVRLESLAPVREDTSATRPTWSLAVALPKAAVVHGTVIAGVGVDEVVLVSDGLSRGASPDREHGWLFAGVPGGSLHINLLGTRRAPQRCELPLRFTSTSATRSEVARARTVVTSWIEVVVLQGALDELRLRLPEEHELEVVSVEGERLAGWTVSGAEVVVTPLAPEEQRLNLEVRLSGRSPERFASPLLITQGALKQFTATAISTVGDALLEVANAGSARLPDQREREHLPPSFRENGGYPLIVADPQRPPQWVVTWPESSEALAAQSDRMLVDVLAGDAGWAAYQVWVEVRSSGAVSLEMILPDGFQLVDAARDGQRLLPGVTARGLQLPLVAAQEPQVLHLSGLVPLTVPELQGDLEVPIPALSAPVTTVQARILVPAGRSYELLRRSQAGSRGSLAPIRPASSSCIPDDHPGARLARWLGSGTSQGNRVTTANGALYSEPHGYELVRAAWSALSADPEPVMIRVEQQRTRREWF